MAGRRLIASVAQQLGPDRIYVVAGLANAYSDYVATREEYNVQHYEGASTLYGPWTHAAYLQQFSRLAAALRDSQPVNPGPTPPDLRNTVITVQPGVIADTVPLLRRFGDVVSNVSSSYQRGATAQATFLAGHPRNNLKTGSTFLEVQLKKNNSWVTVARDYDWSTTFTWKRTNTILGRSEATITWTIPSTATLGTYRIVYHGDYLNPLTSKVSSFTGTSSTFTVK
jgi:neutral ceramidase